MRNFEIPIRGVTQMNVTKVDCGQFLWNCPVYEFTIDAGEINAGQRCVGRKVKARIEFAHVFLLTPLYSGTDPLSNFDIWTTGATA